MKSLLMLKQTPFTEPFCCPVSVPSLVQCECATSSDGLTFGSRSSCEKDVISRSLCDQCDWLLRETVCVLGLMLTIDQYTKMFESRISAGATDKLLGWEKAHAKTVAWSYDMEGQAQKCGERYCERANKKVEQLYKVSSPCLDDHQFKQEELESVEELSQVCSQIVLTCLYLARIGRPYILWSVNKFARAVAKWTQACDRRLARSISYIHGANDFPQYCHVGNTAQDCR